MYLYNHICGKKIKIKRSSRNIEDKVNYKNFEAAQNRQVTKINPDTNLINESRLYNTKPIRFY